REGVPCETGCYRVMNTATKRERGSPASAGIRLPRRSAAHHLLRGRPAAGPPGREGVPCETGCYRVMNTATKRERGSPAAHHLSAGSGFPFSDSGKQSESGERQNELDLV